MRSRVPARGPGACPPGGPGAVAPRSPVGGAVGSGRPGQAAGAGPGRLGTRGGKFPGELRGDRRASSFRSEVPEARGKVAGTVPLRRSGTRSLSQLRSLVPPSIVAFVAWFLSLKKGARFIQDADCVAGSRASEAWRAASQLQRGAEPLRVCRRVPVTPGARPRWPSVPLSSQRSVHSALQPARVRPASLAAPWSPAALAAPPSWCWRALVTEPWSQSLSCPPLSASQVLLAGPVRQFSLVRVAEQ